MTYIKRISKKMANSKNLSEDELAVLVEFFEILNSIASNEVEVID
jgi:hypothetical protein